MEQSPSWEANPVFKQSRNSPHFMEPEGSLPHSQVPHPSTSLYALLTYLLTYLFTHSMEQSPCWEANRIRGIALLFHDHGTRRGWGVSVTSRPLFTPGTHCTGGWVGPRAGPDRRGKSRLSPGFDPRTVEPVASGYNDWATGPSS